MKIDNTIFTNEERAIFALRSLYDQYGYSRYKMGRFEEYDLYVRNKDFLVSDEVITFTDRSGRLMALKPDVTLSIIKNTTDAPGKIQKLYYNENVYRVPEGGRSFKEIMQAGVECVGDMDTKSIAEVVLLAARSLDMLSNRFVLDISHMGFISAVLDASGLSASGKNRALSCFRHKNLHELDEICRAEGVDSEKLTAILDCCGAPAQVLPRIEQLLVTPDEQDAYREFRAVCDALEDSGYGDALRVDFSVGNDLKYYSGVVFKGYVEGIPTGILSGGQYDALLRKMGRNSKAIGFAIYVDLLEKMDGESDNLAAVEEYTLENNG